MAVVVDQMEVVPAQAPAPQSGPSAHAAPDLPEASVEERTESLLRTQTQRAARLRAD
jgi:hypothetical protein